jgi:hypothetical protein
MQRRRDAGHYRRASQQIPVKTFGELYKASWSKQ